MFTVELKINGAPIGVLYGHNTLVGGDDGKTVYHYEYYAMNSGKVVAGNVVHTRSEGLAKLAAICLEAAVQGGGK